MQAQQAGDPKSAQQQQQQQHAYAATRQPVLELLGGSSPLAPASMHLPLLHYLIPLLDTPHMPFTRGDVQLLLRVLMRATSSSKAAVAQAVSQQQHQQQQVLSEQYMSAGRDDTVLQLTSAELQLLAVLLCELLHNCTPACINDVLLVPCTIC
eukprot:jgi/Chrzof1/10362/Cz04g39050.t1